MSALAFPIRVAVFSALCVSLAADAQSLFQDATRLQNDGKFAEALAKWQTFVANYPDDPSVGLAYGGLGVCLLETGEHAKAIAALDQALQRLQKGENSGSLRWNRAIACYRRAEQSKEAKDYQAAAKDLQAIADSDAAKERKALASFYLAKTEQAQAKTDAAKKRFQQLVVDSSIGPHALLALANIAEDAKDWPEATRFYRTFLHDFPKHASADEARLGVADALLKVNELAEAEGLFGELRSHTQFANAAYAHYRWGEAAYLRKDYRPAIERLTEFLNKYPKSPYRPAALLALGEAQMLTKEFDAASRSFAEFVQECDNATERQRIRLRWANALYLAGDAAKAEAAVQEFVGKFEDAGLNAEAWVLFARCAAKLKQPAEAVKRYEACLKFKVEEPEQVRCEAVAQAFAAGDSDHGLCWTNYLIEQAPRSACTSQAQLHAARWQADQGKWDQALARCKWVLDTHAETAQPMALYLTGFCCMRQRKFEEAAKAYETLLAKHPRFEQAPAACYSLGVAHEALGAKSKAIEAYRKMDKDYPNDPLTSKARERLKILGADK